MEELLVLLRQCEDWNDNWMPHWVCVEAGEALFYAPDNELLVCVPTPGTLTDAEQFLQAIALTSTRWAKQQEESQS